MKLLFRLGSGIAIALMLISGVVWAQDKPPRERPTKTPDPLAAPTVDRLAPPPTVLSPTQADDGAHLYWVWCQPCHGDIGQGLTDEWRAEYPEDHQNCWKSGCHGMNPYEGGFLLPKQVPSVIGKGTLLRYQTMGELYEYVRHKMPYEYPGALNEEEALAVTAFLAQKHDKWDGTRLTIGNVDEIRLLPTPEPTATSGEQAIASAMELGSSFFSDKALLLAALLLGLIILGGIWLWRR
jgi:mono/diheme cytochrome c family protein